MNILIRNMTKTVTEGELFKLFQPFGEIKSYNIVMDEAKGQSKGFGFVEMPDRDEASAAIKALDGKLVRGQKIRVKTTVKTGASLPDPRREQPERFENRERKPAMKKTGRGTSGPARRPQPERFDARDPKSDMKKTGRGTSGPAHKPQPERFDTRDPKSDMKKTGRGTSGPARKPQPERFDTRGAKPTMKKTGRGTFAVTRGPKRPSTGRPTRKKRT